MTPTRPYFLRAVYQWIVDNHCTPYVAVNAGLAGVMVPQEYVEDGQITLNIAPGAVVGLDIGDELLSFSARFSGVARNVQVPMLAIIGIYARENGQGMAFPEEYEAITAVSKDDDQPPPTSPPTPPPAGKPRLKVVK